MQKLNYLKLKITIGVLFFFLSAQHTAQAESDVEYGNSAQSRSCKIELIVLGAGQDAGAPQIGNNDDPGWKDPSSRLLASSIALVDHARDQHYLFDATPHISEQLALLAKMVELPQKNLGLTGVFLTHAHIGHYAGLMYLGREAASTSGVPIFAMPRMAGFLANNGPWKQLIDLGNIEVVHLENGRAHPLSADITVTPLRVPHRDEYSETVGFLIGALDKKALYLPDIDSWQEWEVEFGMTLGDIIQNTDIVFVDATFYDDDELPGRDMSLIPHPRVSETVSMFLDAPAEIRNRVHFIHYNHTNPIRFLESAQTKDVVASGFNIARKGDRHCLSGEPIGLQNK